MGKKLTDIEDDIKLSSKLFKDYLKSNLEIEVIDFIEEINLNDNAYIFSGVIRNFFLNKKEFRDLDIVVTSTKKIEKIIKKYKHKKNSFGGYKLSIGDLNIDLWELKKTWALNYNPQLFTEEDLYCLPNTSFFNFSSIVYDFRNESFNYSKKFKQFLQTKKLDIVFPANPNKNLCVVNTIYYSEKFNLKIGSDLKKYLNTINLKKIEGLDETQIKHFGEVKYSKDFIVQKIDDMRNQKDDVSVKKIEHSYKLFQI